MNIETAISAALLRERLADTRMPADPLDVVMPPGSDAWPGDMRKALTRSLRPAGVLIPVLERAGGPSVLLTQRSAELKHHAGQIAFPGGRMEASDADIRATALRETHEEVGIVPDAVSVIGYLKPMPTVTGYAVTAVVGLVDDAAELEIDRSEVEFAFEVPLAFLLDKRNVEAGEREYMGRRIPVIEFNYEGHRIWGATAYFLIEMTRIVV
jgi:8-oxo-dGTP pyrophosphatase MutT (NUDIX family)